MPAPVSCVHVSPYSSPPALLHQPRFPRLLAETFVDARGLGEECTLGQKLHLRLNAKAEVPPPVSGALANPIFVPTLSAADNQAAHEVD